MSTRTIVGAVAISGAAMAAGACGSSSSGGGGLSCAADGVCQPACANDPDCAGDTGAAGSTSSGGATGTPGVGTEVNMLLLLDRSGSMADQPPGYTVDKLTALHQALTPALTGAQDRINFGLRFFPYDSRCGVEPLHEADRIVATIGGGADHVTVILMELSIESPEGGTPTSAALAEAYQYFTAEAGTSLVGNRFVLLVTDGAPTCNTNLSCDVTTCTLNMESVVGCPRDGANCCAGNPEGCLDDQETIAQIQRLADSGISTIVVGIPGSEYYADSLTAFAQAGGFEASGGGYYDVPASGGVEALTDTLQTIMAEVL